MEKLFFGHVGTFFVQFEDLGNFSYIILCEKVGEFI